MTDSTRFNATSEVTWKRRLIPRAGSKPRPDRLGDEDCNDDRHVLSGNLMNMLDDVR